MSEFGPSPVEKLKGVLRLHQVMIEYMSRVFGIPAAYFTDKEFGMDPKEKKDDHEVVQVYDDPAADTIIWYDEDDNQHVEIKDA